MVEGRVGEADLVLVGHAREAVGGRLLREALREAQALGKRFAAPRLLDMQRALDGISNAVQRFSNKNLTLTRLCSTLAAAAKGITGGNYD